MKRKSLLSIDWLLILPVAILVVVSLTTLLSLSPSLFFNQFFTLILGIIAFVFFSQLPYDSLKPLAVPIYIVAFVLLSIVLIIGFESHGAVRWISVFGFSVQFSEILKPFLAIALASFLSTQSNTSWRSFFLSLMLLGPLFLLLAFQPDLGNALIYILVTLIVLLVYGFPLLWFAVVALPFVAASPLLWHALHDYQKQRLLTFINPMSDPLGTSYNVIQAVIAVGSGMLMGKGLAQGTQSGLRFLPERHTDFIFATLSEGMGFVGAFIVIACFIFLCFRIYTIFQRSDDTFAKVFTACAFGLVLVHFFMNIGMNVGLLPIVGVTLPFVSYGGNSLLANLIMLGILSSISTHYRKRDVLEIR
jgi:rod shape determining protein RodA